MTQRVVAVFVSDFANVVQFVAQFVGGCFDCWVIEIEMN